MLVYSYAVLHVKTTGLGCNTNMSLIWRGGNDVDEPSRVLKSIYGRIEVCIVNDYFKLSPASQLLPCLTSTGCIFSFKLRLCYHVNCPVLVVWFNSLTSHKIGCYTYRESTITRSATFTRISLTRDWQDLN